MNMLPLKRLKLKDAQIRILPAKYVHLWEQEINGKKEFKKTKNPLAWSAYKNYCPEVKHEIK